MPAESPCLELCQKPQASHGPSTRARARAHSVILLLLVGARITQSLIVCMCPQTSCTVKGCTSVRCADLQPALSVGSDISASTMWVDFASLTHSPCPSLGQRARSALKSCLTGIPKRKKHDLRRDSQASLGFLLGKRKPTSRDCLSFSSLASRAHSVPGPIPQLPALVTVQ